MKRPRAHRTTLLGMKLQTEHPVAADRGNDRATVVHRRDDRAFVDGLDGV